MLVQLTHCWFAGRETCILSIVRQHVSVAQALYTSSNKIFVRVKPNTTPYKPRGFHQRSVHLFE